MSVTIEIVDHIYTYSGGQWRGPAIHLDALITLTSFITISLPADPWPEWTIAKNIVDEFEDAKIIASVPPRKPPPSDDQVIY